MLSTAQAVKKPQRILCSPSAAEALKPLLAQAGLQGQYVCVHPPLDGQPLQADIAFVSRDVTGASTKFDIKPDTAVFYEALRHAQGLRWVHIHSAGYDRPIFLELQARGIDVSNSAGHNARAVAQTALAGLLALARRLPAQQAAQRQARWEPASAQAMPRDLQGQVAVIVGWGGIGQHIAQVLQVLGVKVHVARHDGTQAAEGAEKTVAYKDLPSLLPGADWLILACPLSEETLGLVDAAALSLLPVHAHVINVARGTVVDESALTDALQKGRLAGAYLDVFEYEPLPADSMLWRLENVIATPHSAGHSDGNSQRVLEMFLAALKRHEAT